MEKIIPKATKDALRACQEELGVDFKKNMCLDDDDMLEDVDDNG